MAGGEPPPLRRWAEDAGAAIGVRKVRLRMRPNRSKIRCFTAGLWFGFRMGHEFLKGTRELSAQGMKGIPIFPGGAFAQAGLE